MGFPWFRCLSIENICIWYWKVWLTDSINRFSVSDHSLPVLELLSQLKSRLHVQIALTSFLSAAAGCFLESCNSSWTCRCVCSRWERSGCSSSRSREEKSFQKRWFRCNNLFLCLEGSVNGKFVSGPVVRLPSSAYKWGQRYSRWKKMKWWKKISKSKL